MPSPAWNKVYRRNLFIEENGTEINLKKKISQHQDLFLSEAGKQVDRNEWQFKVEMEEQPDYS